MRDGGHIGGKGWGVKGASPPPEVLPIACGRPSLFWAMSTMSPELKSATRLSMRKVASSLLLFRAEFRVAHIVEIEVRKRSFGINRVTPDHLLFDFVHFPEMR